MSDEAFAMEEDWDVLKTFFPGDWVASATQAGALKGLRKDKSAEKLLRTVLLHVGCGHSMRETVVRAREAKLADLSDVAFLKRLRKSMPWLRHLCVRLFEERKIGAEAIGTEQMRMLDASLIQETGPTGSCWRLHYCLNWPSLSCEFFKLTASQGTGNGESFAGVPIDAGAHYLADRGYCTARGIGHVVDSGGCLAVRLNPDAIRVCRPQGGLFPLLSRLKQIKAAGEVRQWSVSLAASSGTIAASGRLCVIRKSQEAVRVAHAKLRRKAQKNGSVLRSETLEYARFIIVFTNFDQDRFSANAVLEWYRLRWQIELFFKRLKSIAGLGHLPKHDPACSQAWLYGKLFVALLTEKIMAYAQSFSPWGYALDSDANPQPLA